MTVGTLVEHAVIVACSVNIPWSCKQHCDETAFKHRIQEYYSVLVYGVGRIGYKQTLE